MDLPEGLWTWVVGRALEMGFALLCEEQHRGSGSLGYLDQFYNIQLLTPLGISEEFIEFQNEILGFVSVS